MNCEIITIGDEYLYGKADSSAIFRIYEHISGMGFDVESQTVIASDMIQFPALFNTAMRRSDLIIVIGGFSNPYTLSSRQTIAKALNIKMVNNIKIERRIKELCELLGERFSNIYASLSQFPKNSIIFPNDTGVAYGSCIDVVDHKILILPSNSEELDNMFTKYVIPHLEPLRNTVYCERKICLFGISESTVSKKLKVNFETHNSRITTVQKGGCTIITLRVRGKDSSSADATAQKLVTKIKNMFFDYVCSTSKEDLASIVVSRLIKENKKIATAESCTAGMLSQMITDVSGSSKIFEFGISAYSNRIKTDALGVPETVIERHGAISEQTAILMAKNVREMSGADIGIGITGVAGPDKSENKDVGTIYVAMADKSHGWVRLLKPSGITDRDQLRLLSCNTALDLIRRYLSASKYGVLKDGFDIHNLSRINVIYQNPSINRKSQYGPTFMTNPSGVLSDEEIMQLLTNHIYTDVDDDNDNTAQLNIKTENDFLFEENEIENAQDDTPTLEPIFDIKEFVVEHDNENEDNTNDVVLSEQLSADLETTPQISHEETPKEHPKKNSQLRKIATYIVSLILPSKNDNIKKFALKILSIVLAIIFVVVGCIVIGNASVNSKNRKILTDIRKEWDLVAMKTGKTNLIFDSFDFLRNINNDTIGWLKINNTQINHPVVLPENNEFYLNHNIYKNKSKYGTIFADSDVIIEPTRISQNITLYGGTFADGSMFSELKNYRKLEYYKSHPTVSLKTLYRDNVYKIFSVFIINTDPKDDNSYAFNFAKSSFSDKTDFLAFAAEAKLRSIINTPVDVIEQDELLTLCVPTDEFNGARLIIMARRARNNENYAVDTRLADVNADPIYPAAWYKAKGLNMPNTTSLINSAKESLSSTDTLTSDITSSDTDTSSEQSSSSLAQSSSRPTVNQNTTSIQNTATSSNTSVTTSSTETSSDVISENDVTTSDNVQNSDSSTTQESSEPDTPTTSEPEVSSEPEIPSESETSSEPESSDSQQTE